MIPLYDIELSQLYKVAYAINPIDRKSVFFFFHSPFAFQTRQFVSIECFHSCGQHLCKFIGTKESVYIRRERIRRIASANGELHILQLRNCMQ